MKIAITSQNFRAITGHGGKARRFFLFDAQSPENIAEIGRLDLPMEMAMHGFDDRNQHPLDGTDLLITGSAGDGFVARMARRGIRVVRTGETDPLEAIRGCYSGTLKPPVPHDHDHDHDAQGEGHSCGCGH